MLNRKLLFLILLTVPIFIFSENNQATDLDKKIEELLKKNPNNPFASILANKELTNEQKKEQILSDPHWYEKFKNNIIKQNNDALLNSMGASHSTELPEWLIKASLENAPPLIHGIGKYLRLLAEDLCDLIPSYHRFILVGKPGTGKTTLAQALAATLEYEVILIQASSLFGKYRNEAAVNIRKIFHNLRQGNAKKIIIIDEIHKLFENYESKRTDTYENATTFWGQLDEMEKHNPNIIVIGTANSVDKLPPELKSRFHGKIITMPLPDEKQRLKALMNMLNNDTSIQLSKSVDEKYIKNMILRLKNTSLRDVQLLIDTAKMFRYAQKGIPEKKCMELTKWHFEKALKQLENENKQDWYKRMGPMFKIIAAGSHTAAEIGFVASVALGIGHAGITYGPLLSNKIKAIGHDIKNVR